MDGFDPDMTMLRECSVNRGTLLGDLVSLAHVYTSCWGLYSSVVRVWVV